MEENLAGGVFSAAMLLNVQLPSSACASRAVLQCMGNIVLEAQHKSRLGKDREACEKCSCQGSDTFN